MNLSCGMDLAATKSKTRYAFIETDELQLAHITLLFCMNSEWDDSAKEL